MGDPVVACVLWVWAGWSTIVAGVPECIEPLSGPIASGMLESLTASWDWPSGDELTRVLLLRDYNTRVVLLGTVLLGATAGLVGGFMLLRGQALVGDVVSHASLPGIALMFIVLELWQPGEGRHLPLLSLGAAVAGICGVGLTRLVRSLTRVREDAALAIVLSVFFGAGIVLFTIIKSMSSGDAAGLQSFIFGRAASMTSADVWHISVASAVVLCVSGLLFKEFSLLCFDQQFAAAQGWPVVWLDLMLMGLVVAVAVIGQQSVGLLLVVAMMIIPPAAARFWTDRIQRLAVGAALIGGLGAWMGGLASAIFQRMAAGAVMVLMTTTLFVFSLLVGSRRGVLLSWWKHRQTRRTVALHDLLRSLYEVVELHNPDAVVGLDTLTQRPIRLSDVEQRRQWNPQRLRLALRTARRAGLITPVANGNGSLGGSGECQLSPSGARRAIDIIRNHRMWEIVLIENADVAPAFVDRYADRIEHVVDAELLRTVDAELQQRYPGLSIPDSPHALQEAER